MNCEVLIVRQSVIRVVKSIMEMEDSYRFTLMALAATNPEL